MQQWLMSLKPCSMMGSTLTGSLLFGQLCWTIRELWGEATLISLLDGYVEQRPFAVFSDVLPQNYIPLPAIPLFQWAPSVDAQNRKALKSKKWLHIQALSEPMMSWYQFAKSSEEVDAALWKVRSHNSIDRRTGTTSDDGQYAPFDQAVWSYKAGTILNLYVCLDESRWDVKRFQQAFKVMCDVGIGRDASTGCGHFELLDMQALPQAQPSQHFVSLAAMAPQGLPYWDPRECFYTPMTYFGRHGNVLARSSTPFKKPIVMADTGAFLSLKSAQSALFLGQGLQGHSAHMATVHQGYAPVLGFQALRK